MFLTLFDLLCPFGGGSQKITKLIQRFCIDSVIRKLKGYLPQTKHHTTKHNRYGKNRNQS